MNRSIRLLFPVNLRFVFSYHREQFRNGNKENFPVAKSASAIAKEGGAIWKSMTESVRSIHKIEYYNHICLFRHFIKQLECMFNFI
ncbi:hypothetical protein HanHA300_Chr10g0370781 [Helianthus annuus]|nr:hypothetical protein HanHA300_Chr10g0370781 [Helianthus annuus]